ncbi:MAG: transposase [Candidatus Scatosoma sp.]
MFFVGIDIAKNSHEAAVIDSNGNIVVKPFKFKNSLQGFEKLLTAFNSVSSDLSAFEFGMEATGHYWLNLYTKLIDLNVSVHVILTA